VEQTADSGDTGVRDDGIDRQQAIGVGLHPVELAARRGIGPLSDLAAEAWHGQARPCPSCGQLVRRTASSCDLCGQDLRPQMLLKMQAHAGPWYVLEHVRPFPGVRIERLIRQIRRGVLTGTSIVRGPTTFHQWRFAAETPGLSKYLGLCWRCQAAVSERDTICLACRAMLDGETDVFLEQAWSGEAGPTPSGGAASAAPVPSGGPSSSGGAEELEKLSAALAARGGGRHRLGGRDPRIFGIHVGWIVGALVAILVVALAFVVWWRTRDLAAREPGGMPVAPTTQPAPSGPVTFGGTGFHFS